MNEFLVSVSTGAMTSLLRKLGTMLSDEYKMIKNIHRDVQFLKDELEAMQAFLLMMADVEEPDQQAKLRAKAVRELSYDIEDKIDKFVPLVHHDSSSSSDGLKDFLKNSMQKVKNIKRHHDIAMDIKGIKSQVKEVSERYARYKIDESFEPRNERVDHRLCAVYKDVSELVGIDDPRNELVKWLHNEKAESAQQLKVVSIVGSGGSGKTTLAKQVYDNCGANFECRAFVSMSWNPDMTKILSSVLSQLRNQDSAQAGGRDPQLIIDQIRNFLKDKKYFIIIDDIWDVPTWRVLECAFVKNNCGSRVMSTTRKNDVAKSCCSCRWDLVYKIKTLSYADSKKLFFKRIFGHEESCPSNLKAVSEDILKKCGGLPLAINTVSSLLALHRESKEEWEHVQCSIGFAQDTKNSDIDAMTYILSLSYFDLPLHLRSCLLYLTMFPEDYEIERHRLVHRWISEGFIHSKYGQDLVELGEKYFHELVNRCLIQPVDIGYDGKASRCRVHDTVLDFLIYKSTEENFCITLKNHSKSNSRVRRLSLMGNEDHGDVDELDLSHARSLASFGSAEKYLPSIKRSNALRVLDVHDCIGLGNHHVKDIGRLFQLRYLNISGNWNISVLPRQIGDLKYLETLDVSNTQIVELPESVARLKLLARLFVPGETILPDGIGNMKNLQELWNIHTFKQSLNIIEELGQLTNLRKLRVIWDANKSDKESNKKKMLVSSLCKLDTCKLHTLHIKFHLAKEDATFIGHMLFPALNSVREVNLCGGQICWIANWLVSLGNLQKLATSRATKIDQKDLDIVGSIPNLVEFKSYSGCVGAVAIREGFQQLHELELNFGFTKMFQEGPMPNLKRLCLSIRLDRLDSGVGGGFDLGIQHLSSLAWIRLNISCFHVRAAYVEAAESAFMKMADAHPNNPAIEMMKEWTNLMLHNE